LKTPDSFEIVRIKEPMNIAGAAVSGFPRLELRDLNLACDLDFPSPKFVDAPENIPTMPAPGDQYNIGPFKILSPEIYLIRDCTVWSKYGLVFVENYLIRESMFGFPAHLMPEIKSSGEK
jgi:hypothetical protein